MVGFLLEFCCVDVTLIRAMLFCGLASLYHVNTTANHDKFSYMYVRHDLVKMVFTLCINLKKSGIHFLSCLFLPCSIPCDCLYPGTIHVFLLNLAQSKSFQIFCQTNRRVTCIITENQNVQNNWKWRLSASFWL